MALTLTLFTEYRPNIKSERAARVLRQKKIIPSQDFQQRNKRWKMSTIWTNLKNGVGGWGGEKDMETDLDPESLA